MKFKYFFILILLWVNLPAHAKSKVPSSILTAFQNRFPNALSVKWDKENANEYEATFLWNNIHYSANFDLNGQWLETEMGMAFEALPEHVSKAFNLQHPTSKIVAVSKIETSKGQTRFEVEFKKGVRKEEELFSAEGEKINE